MIGAPVAVLVLGGDGLVMAAEGEGLARLGVREDPAGQSALRLVGDQPDLRLAIERALAGEAAAVEITRDGRPIAVRCEPRRRDGSVVGALVVALDLSETQARERGREQELHLLLRQVPGFAWTSDPNLRITFVIGSAEGLEREEFVGRTVQEIVGTSDVSEPAIAHHLAALAGQRTGLRYRFRDRWYEMLIDPLRDAEDAIVGCVGVAVDVTRRKLADERLARSEARLQQGQRLAHFGSWEWDLGNNQVRWSEEMYRIYGLAPDRFAGTFDAFLDHVHPDDRERVRTVVFETLRTGKPFHFDHRIARPDGEERMLAITGEVIADGQEGPPRVVGSALDITDRWAATRKLERTVSLLQATLEATADGLLVVDTTGKVVAYNQRFLQLWKIPPELARRGDDSALLEFVNGQLEDPKGFSEGVQRLYRQPEAESFDVIRFRDGRVFERLSHAQRVADEVVGRVWSFRDVTERERLLRSALFLADVSRLFVSLDAESALDGLARLSVPFLGDACAVDLFGEGGPRRLVKISRDPSAPIPLELPRTFPTRSTSYVSANGISHMTVPIISRGRMVGALTFAALPKRGYTQDDLDLAGELATRAALAMENEALYRAARDALRGREEFLAVAAHEIRGPVTALLLAAQSMRAGMIGTPAMNRVTELIQREARRLGRLVDELLDLGRIRGGRMHFQLEEVDLAEAVREVEARMGTELTRSGSSLTVHSEPVVGTWDRLRLEQVVSNLLSNAIKFGQGKPIEIDLSAKDGWARLCVRDHGLGIDPQSTERIFEPFERGVPSRQYGGLGVGLYIVRTIVNGLGGHIRCEGRPGEGVTVTVEIPQTRS